MTHWADVLAGELMKRGERHVLATAITPSGPIHVGNMREVLTTEAVFRAVRNAGGEAELLYIGDTYDPLRKRYPFLPASYEEHVGKPLSAIPCPDGCHASYAEHFLDPFLASLEELGVRPTVLKAHEMYESGQYVEATQKALDATGRIRQILEDVAGRAGKLPEGWIPFNVQCANCTRIQGVIPTRYEAPTIAYTCSTCGHQGEKDVREPGGGKLPWRIDWPARWDFLGVTFEAMGKDHAAAGGSWDTGVEIARDVYGREPPVRTVYEFVQVKGKGAMHSSTGTGVSATDMLGMTPPEVLRFLFMRTQPSRHIDFDTGTWIVELVNEYDRWERERFTPADERDAQKADYFKDLERTYELSQPHAVPTALPPQVPYNHLVLLVQMAPDWDEVLGILRRSGMVGDLTPDEEAHLRTRAAHATFWLERYAPEEARTTLAQELTPSMREALAPEQSAYLLHLYEALQGTPWTGDTIHNAIHETAKADELPAGKAFGAVYRIFLDAKRGPRAGYFLASLDRDFVLGRLKEASSVS